MRVLVTGGAGYVGAPRRGRAAGRRARGARARRRSCTARRTWPSGWRRAGVELIARRHPRRRRPPAALDGVEAVVHLAAIVGDPACARDPELSQRRERRGQRARSWRTPARSASSASCSPRPAPTTAEWPTRPCRSTRAASCGPCRSTPSRRSAIEKALLESGDGNGDWLRATCLRFATVYGVGDAHALRPDGQRVHPRPLGRPHAGGVRRALLAPLHPRPRRRPRRAARARPRPRKVAGKVFNAGHSDENYRKLDLVEIITRQARRRATWSTSTATRTRATTRSPSSGSATSSASSRSTGCRTASRSSSGALEQQRFGDPFDGRYRN